MGDVDLLEAAFDCGLRERRFSLSYFERRLRAVGPRGRDGAAALRRLIDDRRHNPPAESGRERRLSRELMAAGLPQPRRQFDIEGMHFDLAYPDVKIAIEFDSYRHHYGRAAWRTDRARHNRAAAVGWLVFHQTAIDGVQAIVEAYRRSMSA